MSKTWHRNGRNPSPGRRRRLEHRRCAVSSAYSQPECGSVIRNQPDDCLHRDLVAYSETASTIVTESQSYKPAPLIGLNSIKRNSSPAWQMSKTSIGQDGSIVETTRSVTRHRRIPSSTKSRSPHRRQLISSHGLTIAEMHQCRKRTMFANRTLISLDSILVCWSSLESQTHSFLEPANSLSGAGLG